MVSGDHYNADVRSRHVALPAAVILLTAVALGSDSRDHTRGAMSSPQTIARHFTPADRATGRYQYVPFDVPVNTRALTVRYQYDRANGDNVIDLGLFEPGSLDLGTPAFRGYSGGARTSVTIGQDAATPGYRPGPLPAGRWNVLLGLYKVRDAGVDVTIDIEIARASSLRSAPSAPGAPLAPKAPSAPLAPSAPAAPLAPKAPSAPARGEAPRWYMGALHTHTLHSDGTVTPAELMRMMREANFDFVAITDHNNTTHTYELGPQYPTGARPLWIVGEEVTTPGGHASVWGLHPGDWVDFRVSPGDPRIADLVAATRRLGGLLSINHPASECLACGWTHDFVDGIEGIEISNGRHGELQNALAIWDALLRKGRRMTGVGSSDWHSAPNPIDTANVRVLAPALTVDAILTAIRRGHVIVMRRARDQTPQIAIRAGTKAAQIGESLTVAAGETLTIDVAAPDVPSGSLVIVANGERGSTPLDTQGKAQVERAVQPGYLRLEILDNAGETVAIANPVYLIKP
jgi:hypothetical protein